MKMVYIASLFRGDYDTNLKNAIQYCKTASDLGVLPVAPHIMYSGFCRDTIPEERKMGLKLGLELLSQSAELWVMGPTHSEGMKGEILYAKEHDIPTYYIPEPEQTNSYPISIDNHSLLCKNDCNEHGLEEDLTGYLVILSHNQLKPEHRSSINQLWMVTHGPGCHPDSFTGTIHLRHPIDNDQMAVGRHELCGVASLETLERMAYQYPDLANSLEAQAELEDDQIQ